MQKVIDYINNNISQKDKVILGVSGGPDSMCLLDLLCKEKINVICAFVDHNTRKEIKKEKDYVENYCKKHNIIFEYHKIEERITKDFENKARKIRYEFFKSLKDKYSAKYILTAHHADDQIETILMRLVRGSNLNGYAGIKMKEKDYIRPLLLCDKTEILSYLKKNNIKYFVDKTNNKDEHTRNRFRHNIIPYIKKENPNVSEKFRKFSNELYEYNNFVNEYIENKKLIKNNEINITLLKKESNFIQKKVIEALIRTIQEKDLLEVSDKNTEDILKVINSRKPNLQIDLNNGYIAKKDYNIFNIEKENINEDFNKIFNDYFENDKYLIKKVKENNKKSNFVLRLDLKDVILPLYIRNKKESDKIELKNLGTKKVKDIFINEKIPLSKRKTIPMLCDSTGKILWIIGIKKSKFDKEINEKYDIILLAERK